MTSLLLDPYLFTVPSDGSSSQEVQIWWDSLSQWLTTLGHSKIEWVHVYDCLSKLDELSRSINFQRLRTLGLTSGVPINPSVLLPLQRELQTEQRDYVSKTVTKYVISESELSITPVVIVERNRPEIQQFLIDALGCLGVDQALGSTLAIEMLFVTSPVDGSTLPDRMIVDGEATLIDPDHLMEWLSDRLISGSFPLLSHPDELSDMPPGEIVALGETEVLLHIERLARTRFPTVQLLRVRFHRDFTPSLAASGIIHNEDGLKNLFERSSEVIAGQASLGARLEQIRQSESGSSPQVRRADGATAWRVSISMSGVAWRLHYWSEPDQPNQVGRGVQLCCVLRHSDPVRMPID